ncbi:hypothetical protein H4R35_006979 [Dimargaris xerosporica]|nr:hypothetical protein H4R35_006979 [Dimargaris xerosporica]
MKVLLASLFLHATLPGYLAQMSTFVPISSQPNDGTLAGTSSIPGLGRELYPVERAQNPVNYVQNTAGKTVLMVLGGKKCLGLVGTQLEDVENIDADVISDNCSESDDSSLEILQEDGSTRKVGGFFRNSLRRLFDNELDQKPDVPIAPFTRRATKSRGDYAALKRRSPRQFANHATLRRRDAEVQLAVHQQLQRRTATNPDSPNAVSSPSSSSNEDTGPIAAP